MLQQLVDALGAGLLSAIIVLIVVFVGYQVGSRWPRRRTR